MEWDKFHPVIHPLKKKENPTTRKTNMYRIVKVTPCEYNCSDTKYDQNLDICQTLSADQGYVYAPTYCLNF